MTLRREASIAMNMKEVCRHIEVLMSQTFNLILWWIKYFGQFLTHQVLVLPDFSSYHFLFRIWELDWSLTSRGCRILPSPALSTCQSLEWVCSTTTPSMRWETWGETTASTCSSRRPTPRTWSRRPRDKHFCDNINTLSVVQILWQYLLTSGLHSRRCNCKGHLHIFKSFFLQYS